MTTRQFTGIRVEFDHFLEPALFKGKRARNKEQAKLAKANVRTGKTEKWFGQMSYVSEDPTTAPFLSQPFFWKEGQDRFEHAKGLQTMLAVHSMNKEWMKLVGKYMEILESAHSGKYGVLKRADGKIWIMREEMKPFRGKNRTSRKIGTDKAKGPNRRLTCDPDGLGTTARI